MKKRNIGSRISNRVLYTLIAVGILLIVGVGVYAYGTSTPAVFGHSLNEIQFCAANQILQMNPAGNAWTCTTGALTKSPSAIYTVNTYCASAGALTTIATCTATSTGYCSFGNGQNNGIRCYNCNGGTQCQSYYIACPSCSNNLLGYLVN